MDTLPSLDLPALLAGRRDTINLAAGPSSLPTPVLVEACSGLLNYKNSGIGLSELSHRSALFQNCLKEAEHDLRTLLEIPEEYEVLFMQGGGLTQFSCVPLNLVPAWKVSNKSDKNPKVEYVVSGSWSQKAAGEAKRLGMDVNIVVDGRERSTNKDKKVFGDSRLPPAEEWKWSGPNEGKPAYIYYCSNETVNGIEIPPPNPPAHLKDVPIVADMSSNILSRRVPWKESNFGVVYAGAQKNIGPAGLTIVIIRKDLIVDPDAAVQFGGSLVPSMLSYKAHADGGSLYNTPPMFPIYVAGLVFKYLLDIGGVDKVEEVNEMKATSVYRLIEESNGFYQATVKFSEMQSRMNVCFRLPGAEGREERFVKEAEKQGIKQVKGHRSVGGIRASLYNAVTLDQVKILTGFMQHFMQKEQEIEKYTKDD